MVPLFTPPTNWYDTHTALLVEIGSHFLSRLASNCDLPILHLPSSWDYRHVSFFFFFFFAGHFKNLFTGGWALAGRAVGAALTEEVEGAALVPLDFLDVARGLHLGLRARRKSLLSL
jgi:hypothetical protein